MILFIPPSEHVCWKVITVLGLPTLYIIGAHVYFHNGWSHDDFKGLSQQIIGAVTFVFGPGWLHRMLSSPGETPSED